jgi:hypothetical protein
MSSLITKGNASGTGSVTLESPNTNSDFTLTVPAHTGTLLTTASSGQSIPKAALPTGSVLQVVSASTNTQTEVATATYTDTGLTATITPLFSSSKILVLVSANGLAKRDQNTYGNLQLVRGSSTSLIIFGGQFGFTGDTSNSGVAGASVSYLDSPATTSATSYKVQVNNILATGSIRFNWDTSSHSTITLMEIAA